MSEELKPCPFCGETPDLPSGDGTYYVIECGECGWAVVGIQICDLMTGEERSAEKFTDYRYSGQYVERAKAEAIKQWNTRATPPAAQVQGERERERAVHAAFNDWSWNKKGEAVGRMDGQAAAYEGFHAGAEWQSRAALSAPPAAGVPEGTLAGYVIPTCNPVEDGYTCTVNPAAEGKYKRPVYFAAPAGGVAEDARAALEAVRELVSLFADSEDDSYEPWKDVGMHPALRMTLGQYRALAKIFAPTPPASEPWRCQHCHSETAQACRDGGCFGVDAEPASEQQQAVVLPDGVRTLLSRALSQIEDLAKWSKETYEVADGIEELLRLNPHLAGVNQGVTEAGNGGDA